MSTFVLQTYEFSTRKGLNKRINLNFAKIYSCGNPISNSLNLQHFGVKRHSKWSVIVGRFIVGPAPFYFNRFSGESPSAVHGILEIPMGSRKSQRPLEDGSLESILTRNGRSAPDVYDCKCSHKILSPAQILCYSPGNLNVILCSV